ncbi:MAG: hypothetical protein OYL97_16150 [Candidatus Poribacteria bacterium]|nr:hypothetical protein [Candidatus Poribacteria bacterium]
MLAKYRYLQSVFILLSVVASNSFAGGWEQVTELPISRFGNAAAAVDGRIYIIGGYDRQKNLGGRAPALSIVDVYDTQTNTWHTVANMPTPRVDVRTAVFSNEIYVFGGYDRKGPRGTRRNKKTVEMYDTRTDAWVKKRDMPSFRIYFTTVVVDGKIYVIGGKVEGPFNPKSINLVEIYDPLTNTWEKRADMPTARALTDAVVVDDKVYVLGGQKTWMALNIPGLFVRSIEEYNPKTDTWRQLPEMSMFKGWFSTVAVDNEIYTIGGINNEIKHTGDVDVYNPITNKWRKVEPMTFVRTTMPVVVKGTIYVLGGIQAGPKFSPIVEAYDTGFRAVTAKGKLSTNWGKLKAENQK